MGDLLVALPTGFVAWNPEVGIVDAFGDGVQERAEAVLAEPFVVMRAEAGEDGQIADVAIELQPGTMAHARAALGSLKGAVFIDDEGDDSETA